MINDCGWLGQIVDSHLVQEKLGQGPFSTVYLGVHEKTLERRVFKVAASVEEFRACTNSNADTGGFARSETEALMFITGGVLTIDPDPSDVLEKQAKKLQQGSDTNGANDIGIVNALQFTRGEKGCFYSMKFADGRLLKDLINDESAGIDILLNILETAAAIERSTKFLPHGDLKPENIIVAASGIKLIDPGYSGKIRTARGNETQCVITTPAYYPLLELDDCLAMGIIAWEIMLKFHPLQKKNAPIAREELKDKVGKNLYNWVSHKAVVGQHYLAPLLTLQRPSELDNELSTKLESFLLQGLKLTINERGQLDKGNGFKTFSDMHAALKDAI